MILPSAIPISYTISGVSQLQKIPVRKLRRFVGCQHSPVDPGPVGGIEVGDAVPILFQINPGMHPADRLFPHAEIGKLRVFSEYKGRVPHMDRFQRPLLRLQDKTCPLTGSSENTVPSAKLCSICRILRSSVRRASSFGVTG